MIINDKPYFYFINSKYETYQLCFQQANPICYYSFHSFYSCGSTKETPYIPSPVENAIHESFKKDDVRELIIHYLNFPNYRNQLAGYLLYDRTYENESYTDLLDYKELALDNTFLSEAFDNIIKQREYQVLTNLSKCSINEIVNYYQSYNDEQCF